MENNKLLTSLIDHSKEKIKLAKSLHGSCVRKNNKVKSKYRLIVSSYFSRAFELFESILFLVENDRIADAGVLLRSLANLIVNLGYIDKKKEERATLFLYDLATQHRKLYEKSKDFFYYIGKSRQVDYFIDYYRNEEKRFHKIIKKNYPNAKPWDKVGIKERSKAYPELVNIYNLIYADLSRYEHHDFSAMRGYVNPNTYDPIIKTGPRKHSPILNHEHVLELANSIFGFVMEFFNGEFQLKWRPKIDEMTHNFMVMTGLKPT